MSRPRDLILLLAVAIATRALAFGNPLIHVDEEFYLTVADAWAGGALPYVDVWDRKPVGLFLLYLPAAALGWPAGLWAYHALALTSAVATAATIAHMCRRVGWGAAGGLAAAAYIVWLPLAEGQGGQSPVFYNLATALAAALLVGRDRIGGARAAAAMLLVGAAMQVKYSVVFEGAFFGLWVLWRGRRGGACMARLAATAAVLVLVALLPTLAVAAAYAAIGRLDAFWFANFASILSRRANPVAESLGNLAVLVAVLLPLVVLAGAAWRERRHGAGETGFVFGWLAASLAGVAVFGGWFDHYALPVLVPACVAAAGALAARAAWRRRAVAGLLVVAVAGQALLVHKRALRGTPDEFAALVRAVGRGPGCLWVQSGSTLLHPATGRCRPSRFVFPSHLGRAREAGAVGVDQMAEVGRILSLRPAVIVLRPPYRGERADMRALAERAVARDYRLAATVTVGRERWRVFHAIASR